MFESPGRRYFEDLRRNTGFHRSPLEKVYRLIDILKEIRHIDDLNGKFALKGGTALQLFYFQLSRLSIDVDMNYIGSTDRNIMQSERADIRKALEKVLLSKGYLLDKVVKSYALEQFDVKYTDVAGNPDRLKLEINYLERMPLLDVSGMKLEHPFENIGMISFQTYRYEEHMAQKTRALLTRATPRDLFDVYRMVSIDRNFDHTLFRKLALFYLLLAPVDVRRINTGLIEDIDDRAVRSNLMPLLSGNEERPSASKMKATVLPLLRLVLNLTEIEIKVFDNFYEHLIFDPTLFFEEIDIEANVIDHPSLRWRIERLKGPVGPE